MTHSVFCFLIASIKVSLSLHSRGNRPETVRFIPDDKRDTTLAFDSQLPFDSLSTPVVNACERFSYYFLAVIWDAILCAIYESRFIHTRCPWKSIRSVEDTFARAFSDRRNCEGSRQ